MKSFSFSSRSVELNGFAALRDQYLGTPVSTHYQYLPHLFSYSAHSALLAPQPRSLEPQSHSLISQLLCAEDLEPLGTPMLIEDGCVSAGMSPECQKGEQQSRAHPALLGLGVWAGWGAGQGVTPGAVGTPLSPLVTPWALANSLGVCLVSKCLIR